ncbi:MAG: transposase, partial [Mycobacteriales bacterium]
QTPAVTGTGKRHSIGMVSAVSPQGLLHWMVFEGKMNAEVFVDYCTRLLHDIPGPIFLIVDGSSVHTAKRTRDYVESTAGRLKLFVLPPYSPDLGPDEWVWKNVKSDRIAKMLPKDSEELKSFAVRALERLAGMPELVQGFFRDPKLAYISA